MRRGEQPPWIVSDESWAEVEPLRPPRPPRRYRYPGRVSGGERRLPRPGTQGAAQSSPSPVHRRKPGSKHHVITDAGSPPRHGPDRRQPPRRHPTHALVDKIPPIRGTCGRPRQPPHRIHADRGYGYDCYRRQIRAKGITPVVARRGTGHGSGLGARRWVVEQTIALLHRFRRLRIRWEIRDDIH
ncbi:transposase [Micromonospora sp. NPDC047134]|uniref:transposase n=1 Tax=Micromonospora sp. NPDC047134 TaxID=3154340 RepID=UPI00340EB3BE